MEKAIAGFILSFLVFVFSVMLQKWEGLYISLPGMFISAVTIAYTFLGGS